MTNVRRLLVVTAGIALTAMISSSLLRGDGPAPGGKKAPPDAVGKGKIKADEEAVSLPSKFETQPLINYEPLKGDPLFALQIKPELPDVPRRPRDIVLVVSTAAGQAGAPLNSSKQLAEHLMKNIKDEDRVALWILGTPDAKFTRNLTGDFIAPAKDKKAVDKALADLKTQYPAGNNDLKDGLKQVIASFTSADRHRIIIYMGDGQSLSQPVTSADRAELCKTMIDKKITCFPIPMGATFAPENLHGLATGTGGKLVRVKILDEKVDDALARLEKAISGPVLYPESLKLSDGVVEHLPTKLPPLRQDTPTLLAGRYKGVKEITYTVEGKVDGLADVCERSKTLSIPKAEHDNYFLVGFLQQWKQAPTEHAMIQADRALVSAFEATRIYLDELNDGGSAALGENDLIAAKKLFEMAGKINPHDPAHKAGLKVVSNLSSGAWTKETMKAQFLKAINGNGAKIEKVGGQIKITTGQLLALAQLPPGKDDPKPAPKVGDLKPEPGLLEAHKTLQKIEEQKLTQTIEEMIVKAKSLLKIDPVAARDMLKQTLLQTMGNEDLSQKVRENLTSQLKTALRQVEIEGVKIVQEKAGIDKMTAISMANLEKGAQVVAVQAQMEAKYNIYKALVNQARLDEKQMRDIMNGMLAIKAEAKAKGVAVPVQTDVLYFQTQARFNLQKLNELKVKREFNFLQIMMNVEKTHVPFPDEPPIHFPPLPMWKAITDLRKEKYEVSSLPDDYKARQEAMEIYKMLEEPIEMKDFQIPMKLKEAVMLFYEKMAAKGKQLPILIDSDAFKAENPAEPPVEETAIPPFPNYLQKLSMATALKLVLSKVPTNNASYVIRKNHIEITTNQRVVDEKVLRVYPVGTLVLPIQGNGNVAGMQGQIQGGFQIGGIQPIGGGFQIGGIQPIGGGFQIGGIQPIGGGFQIGGIQPIGGGFQIGGIQPIGGGFQIGGIQPIGGGFQIGGIQPIGGGFQIGGIQPIGGGFQIGGFQIGGIQPIGGGFQIGGIQPIGGGFQIGGFQIGGIQPIGGGFQIGGQQGNFAGGFNGNLGFQGATQAQPLIQLITQVVAPGEWGLTPQQNAFQQTQGGFAAQAGLVGLPGGIGAAAGFVNVGIAGAAGFPGAGGFQPIGGGFPGGAAGIPGGAGGVVGFQGPQLQPLTIDYTKMNTIDFFAPALALVVRAPTRIHYKETGGVIGGAKKNAIQGPPIPGLGMAAPGKGVFAGVTEEEDAENLKKWDEILSKGADPGMVIATADFLFDYKKYKHVTAMLKANLRHGIIVQPWVYDALAIAMEISGEGTPEEIKRLQLSNLSLEPNNAYSYLKAAETMAKHKDWEHALAYCRQAALIEPNGPEAYELALDYAKGAKDIQGMAWAAGELLRREWPLDNEVFHLKAKSAVDKMTSVLTQDGKKEEVAKLLDMVQKAQERDLVVKLHWVEGNSGPADFELMIKEPNGSVCSTLQRLTPGGGTMISNNLQQATKSSYVAAEAFAGEYQVTIKPLWGQPLGSKVFLEIIRHSGTTKKQSQRLTIVMKNDASHTEKFTLDDGRRTEVAVVPPVLPQSQSSLKKQNEADINVFAKLRDLADPFFSGNPSKGFMGGVGASSAATAVSLQGNPQQKKAQAVFSTAIPSSSGATGFNVIAQTTVTSDGQVKMQVIPSFSMLHHTDPTPEVFLPLIPGGKAK